MKSNALANRRPARWSSVLMLVCPAAAFAQSGFSVGVAGEAQFSSALYGPLHVGASDSANSLAGWTAVGQHLNAETGRVPVASIFSQDGVRAWADFRQVDGNGEVRGFAQAGGYYLNLTPETFARSTVDVHNLLHVVNNLPVGVDLTVGRPSHGTLLSGGLSNIMTARASESTVAVAYKVIGAGGVTFGGSVASSGSLSYLHDDSGAHFTESGDWTGYTRPFTGSVVGFTDPFEGVELATLGVLSPLPIGPGEEYFIDVTFSGTYEVLNTGSRSGFLSFGQADFSGTSGLRYGATDPVTGAPIASGVTIEYVESIPGPGLAGTSAATGVWLGLGRRRRTGAGRTRTSR